MDAQPVGGTVERISASAGELLDQASMTADTYLQKAIRSIDAALGKGYAKEHPELVAAMIRCA
jgi:hypothetical protein